VNDERYKNEIKSSVQKLAINSSGDRSSSYEYMKKIIEHQNDVISKIQDEIHCSVRRNASDYEISRLASNLEEAKVKLRKLVQLVIVEQRKRKDDAWKPIRVSIIDDL
jgi:hypothetical protein